MRDFEKVDEWLDNLLNDVYPQPPDEGHTQMANEAINAGLPHLTNPCESVLDVGCGGTAFCANMFINHGMRYAGVAVRDDAETAMRTGLAIYNADFTFLNMIRDNEFDLVFSRHSLEHSPMPIITLFEWARIARKYVWLILPNPEYWGRAGKNHYSVMYLDQAVSLLERVGLQKAWTNETKHELWIIAEK